MRRQSRFEIECLCGRQFSLEHAAELGCVKCQRNLVVQWQFFQSPLLGSQSQLRVEETHEQTDRERIHSRQLPAR